MSLVRSFVASLLLVISLTAVGFGEEAKRDVPKYLQDISVMVLAGSSSGSGTIVTRKIDGENVNFVLGCGHVVAGLRRVREVVDSQTGQKKQVIEFEDASVVQSLVENGRRIGEYRLDAKVIKYSDADNAHDISVLMIRKKNYTELTAEFDVSGDMITPIGVPVMHCGSMLGSLGERSIVSGVMSYVGRVYEKQVYDQSDSSVFPGSSGGCLSNSETGKFLGIVVRGAQSTFTLAVPLRRVHKWASENDMLFLLDKTVKAPTMDKLLSLPVESSPSSGSPQQDSAKSEGDHEEEFFKFLIGTNK